MSSNFFFVRSSDEVGTPQQTATVETSLTNSEVNRRLVESVLAEEGMESYDLTLAQNDGASSTSGDSSTDAKCIDRLTQTTDDQPAMTTSPTREELDAKLQYIEARMDMRVAEVVGRMDTMIAEMRSDRDRTSKIEQSITELRTEVKSSEREMQAQTSSLKTTFIVTALASVLSIVGGVAAFNSTVLSNMVASFESGKNTAQSLGDTTRRLEDIQKRLEAMQSQQPKQNSPSK